MDCQRLYPYIHLAGAHRGSARRPVRAPTHPYMRRCDIHHGLIALGVVHKPGGSYHRTRGARLRRRWAASADTDRTYRGSPTPAARTRARRLEWREWPGDRAGPADRWLHSQPRHLAMDLPGEYTDRHVPAAPYALAHPREPRAEQPPGPARGRHGKHRALRHRSEERRV